MAIFCRRRHPSGDNNYPPNLPGDEIRHNNNTPERYSSGADNWTLMSADITAPNGIAYETDSYPRFHLMPDGLLFSDTAGKDTGAGATSKKRLFDRFAGAWTGPDIGNLGTLPSVYNRRSERTSVLLPLLPPTTGADFACNSGDDLAFYHQRSSTRGSQQPIGRRCCRTPTRQRLRNPLADWSGFPAVRREITARTIRKRRWWCRNSTCRELTGITETLPARRWEDLSDQRSPRQSPWLPFHGVAPPMAVWHGGSTTTQDDPDGDGITGDGPDGNIDIFEPDYIDVAGRPTITSCPANIGYAMAFPVETPQANSIARVAHPLRCDHARFQHRPALHRADFFVQDKTPSVSSPPRGEIAPPGYSMLWLIDNQERICQRASFIRVSTKARYLGGYFHLFDFQGRRSRHSGAMHQALFVVADGFLPSEVTAPTYQLLRLDNSPVPGVTAIFAAPKYEAGGDEPILRKKSFTRSTSGSTTPTP